MLVCSGKVYTDLLAAIAPNALASRVSLTWDPVTLNSDGSVITNLAGYRIHYGTESGSYEQTQDVVGTNVVTISDLSDAQRYFFAVTGYTTGQVEGDISQELSWQAKTSAGPNVQA